VVLPTGIAGPVPPCDVDCMVTPNTGAVVVSVVSGG
jgi:hypothetical protein